MAAPAVNPAITPELRVLPGFFPGDLGIELTEITAGREGDVLEAVAEPLHVGRRTQVWEVRMSKGDRLVANFVCTQMVLPAT